MREETEGEGNNVQRRFYIGVNIKLQLVYHWDKKMFKNIFKVKKGMIDFFAG